MRPLKRNLRGYIAGLAGQTSAQPPVIDEAFARPYVVQNLPTPLVLAATADGLALTATSRPLEVDCDEQASRESAVVPVLAVRPVMPEANVMSLAPVAPAVPAAPVVTEVPAVPDAPVVPAAPDVPAAPAASEPDLSTPAPVRKPRPKRRGPAPEPAGPVARPGEPQIEFRDVSVSFGSISALRGLTFTINSGELVFLVGASGAGKTTMFRLISGQIRPGKGHVWVDRTPVHKARRHSVAALRRRLGFVGEDYGLLANRTSLENVEFALRMSDLTLPASEVRRRALAELRNVALAARGSALPGQLSTGQRQRLSLARALVTRPVVLLADEPTAGLDSRNAMRVVRLLQRAAARQTAVLVATHDGPMAASVVARVLSLDKGRLVGDFPSWVELCRRD